MWLICNFSVFLVETILHNIATGRKIVSLQLKFIRAIKNISILFQMRFHRVLYLKYYRQNARANRVHSSRMHIIYVYSIYSLLIEIFRWFIKGQKSHWTPDRIFTYQYWFYLQILIFFCFFIFACILFPLYVGGAYRLIIITIW